jgi:hypothetical protein
MARASITDLTDIDQFFHAYGVALAEWAVVEFRLCSWFQMAAGLTISRAEAIFFSGRSFQTRAEMLSAALEHSKLNDAWTAFAEEALAKAITYSSYRNHIAHGQVERGPSKESDPDHWRLCKPHEWREGEGVGRQSLANATENFFSLAEILSDGAWLQARSYPPTAEFLERLEALPNEAGSKSLSQKQRGRERQRKAALRSKSKPQ